MKKVEVLVEFTLMKRMEVELENDNFWVPTVEKLAEIYKSEEDYKDFISQTLPCEIYASEIDQEDRLFTLVKAVIDKYDPFVLFPDAPYDEYDGESRNISEELREDMTKEEIAHIIAKEFTRSFSQDFTIDDCMWPARYIHSLLEEA